MPIYDKLNLNNAAVLQSKIYKEKYKNNTSEINFQRFKNDKYSLNKCGLVENGKYNLAYKKDKFGYRENQSKYYKKTDIVLIGDSFIYGVCVNSPYDIVSQLRKLSSKQILNLSIMGSGPKKQLGIMKSCTKKTSFKTFIWFFYEGNDSEMQTYNSKKECYEYPHNMPKAKLDKKDFIISYNFNNINFFTKLKILVAEKLRGLSTLTKYFTTYPNMLNYKAYDQTVDQMAQYLNQKEVKRKIIFYIPKYTRLSMKTKKNHPQLKQLNKLKSEVREIALKNGFEFMDSTNDFKNLKKPLFAFNYEMPTHFSEKGSKVLAESVYNYLSKK